MMLGCSGPERKGTQAKEKEYRQTFFHHNSLAQYVKSLNRVPSTESRYTPADNTPKGRTLISVLPLPVTVTEFLCPLHPSILRFVWACHFYGYLLSKGVREYRELRIFHLVDTGMYLQVVYFGGGIGTTVVVGHNQGNGIVAVVGVGMFGVLDRGRIVRPRRRFPEVPIPSPSVYGIIRKNTVCPGWLTTGGYAEKLATGEGNTAICEFTVSNRLPAWLYPFKVTLYVPGEV